ncbi:hypothetical protein JXA85_02135 [Candidatus Woesearchaeota archaeon]|nr:hypothetical protein [Candidatus Woesearchaeota archaeon]
MKALVFDAGPIISLALNNLLWTMEPLKKKFSGDFLMTKRIKEETIDKPLEIKRFSFEALQVLELVKNRTIRVVHEATVLQKAEEIIDLCNNIFCAHNHPIQIAHFGEIESIAYCVEKKCNAIVIDERTVRDLIEKPKRLHVLLERKLHTKITVDKDKLKRFSDMVRDIRVIRSVELVTLAFEFGLLDRYVPLDGDKSKLLDALLWGVKLKGCAVSGDEIIEIEKIEK